jgi:hypothetical protein
LRTALRQLIRQRFVFRCAYCGITEEQAGALLTIDHFQPRSENGSDDAENLIYCCHACNEAKGDYWQPESENRILHPERDDISAHIITGDDGLLVGLTATGRFHLEHLQLNRPALVAHRRRLLRQEQDRIRLDALEMQLREIRSLLHQIRAVLPIEIESSLDSGADE